MELNRFCNIPIIAVALLLCMVVAVDSGIPSEARHICKAFDHQRLLQVDGCEDRMIPDRMCRGLCPSYVFPKLKNSQQRDRSDNIEISKNKPASPIVKDSVITAGGEKDDKDSDEDDDMIVIEQSDEHNQCLMCLPKRRKEESFTVKCRREQLNRNQGSSSNTSPKHPWLFGVGRLSGEAIHELRIVKVDILQECECQQVKCQPWTNPLITKDEKTGHKNSDDIDEQ